MQYATVDNRSRTMTKHTQQLQTTTHIASTKQPFMIDSKVKWIDV
jgi:hypothetical protein